MANADEKKPPRQGLGWFPKLILWAAVIAFGYVYLSSVDREGGGIREGSLLDSLAKLSPVSLDALPGFGTKQETKEEQPAPATAAVAQEEKAARPEATSAEPTKPAEPAKVAQAESAEATEPTPVRTATPPPVSYESLALPAPKPTPAPRPSTAAEPTPSAAPQAQVSQATEQAPASTTASSQPATASPEPPAKPAPAPEAPAVAAVPPVSPAPDQMPAQSPPQMPVEPPPPFGPPTAGRAPSREDLLALQQQRQADIMARHEAMRREAEERMRRYWEERPEAARPPLPPYAPYGYYPGYAPGYWLPYPPIVYGPPR